MSRSSTEIPTAGVSLPKKETESQKLPGLNGLRAIAASYVLVAHFYQIAGLLNDKNAENICNSFFHNNWFDPVNLFFTISGFIISLLLLKEREKTNSISLKSFYIKRFLRIWPLYFFVFFVVFILNISTNLYSNFANLNTQSFWVVGLFLVTLNVFLEAPLSVLLHYWSISVEEQFYLFWPVFLKKFHIVKVCSGFLASLVLIRNCVGYFAHHSVFSHEMGYSGTLIKFVAFLNDSKFSSMAIGGFSAYIIWSKWPIINLFKNLYFKLAVWGLFILQFFFKPYIPYVNSEVQSIMYALLIMAVIQDQNIFLDNKIVDLTGQISYGIYMYHWPLIPIVIIIFKKFQIYDSFSCLNYIPLVISIYLINYIIAYISFFHMETPILKLKKHFNIKS